MERIRIATRASKLAMAQSRYVADLLCRIRPGLKVAFEKITTKGDRDHSDFLYKAGSVGFFTSRVEKSLLERRADVAVHSFKDLPTAHTEDLTIAAVPERAAAADALVSSVPAGSISDLPAGATVGTSSVRRIAQLRLARPDIECVPLRGNVETRVRKVMEGSPPAIVVACAGLHRLGLDEVISAVLPPAEFVPAPGQGALAVQVRTEDTELAELVRRIDHAESRIAVEAERVVLAAVHGGCSIPLGVYAEIEGRRITIRAIICDDQTGRHVRRSAACGIDEAESCAKRLAEELLAGGGRHILEQINRRRSRPKAGRAIEQ